jgi:hypothetical protein
MVEGLIDVPPGTVFAIEFDQNHVVTGTCRWSKADRMGVEFASLIRVERVRNPEKAAASLPIGEAYKVDRKRA